MVSIIVPVYNVEPYLNECLDSLLQQTYRDIEILLVDDGSTDRSGDICDEYAMRDARIVVTHQKNKGLSAARNTALDQARGKYIMFVDSDDYVMADYVSHMVSLMAQEKDADIAICRFYNCYEQKGGTYLQKPCISQPEKYVMSGMEILPRRFDAMKIYYVVPWNKIFRREIFAEIRFPEGQVCEDAWVSLDYYRISKKVVCTDEMLYCYRSRSDSITHKPSTKYVEGQLLWLEREIRYFAEAGQKENLVYPARLYISMRYKNRNLKGLENSKEREECWNTAIKALLADKDISVKDMLKYRLRNIVYRMRKRKS